MTSASTRASAIVHLGKSTKRAWGYGDDRRCRPAALPPLPEQARKAGKCSPSTTYPQAPSPTKNLMLITRRLESWQQPSRQPRPEPTSNSAGLHLKTRLRLSHVRGPPQCDLHFARRITFLSCAGNGAMKPPRRYPELRN